MSPGRIGVVIGVVAAFVGGVALLFAATAGDGGRSPGSESREADISLPRRQTVVERRPPADADATTTTAVQSYAEWEASVRRARPQYLIGSGADLVSLPATGPAWSAVVEAAHQPIVVDLADQELASSAVFAAGLVYARTGEERYRDAVVEALEALPGTERGGRVLSIGRQLAGWVLAADLVGYRDPEFVEWLDRLRTDEIGGHGRWVSLAQTHTNTASNWGTFAGAGRLAASLYLGDENDVAAVSRVFRGWLGERDFWSTVPDGVSEAEDAFVTTNDFDASWACDPEAWSPVNGSCGERDGALVEDISRGDRFPDVSRTGILYSWEGLHGATIQALLLSAAGYDDVWEWGNRAMLRSVQFLERVDGLDDDSFHRIHHWVPEVVDVVYGTSFGSDSVGAGRSIGFVPWLAPMLSTR